MDNILYQGAEAIIIKNKSSIIKNRIKKSYRLPTLDEKLIRQRTKKEVKLLTKSLNIIPVPKVLSFSENNIELEHIKGKKLSLHLDTLKNSNYICKQIGKNIAKLHDLGIIHSDLTTSNMIYFKNKVYFIDFGLGFESHNIEDKAADLHLLKQALKAKHFKFVDKFWKNIILGYRTSHHFKNVLQRLDMVEKRGRYKEQY